MISFKKIYIHIYTLVRYRTQKELITGEPVYGLFTFFSRLAQASVQALYKTHWFSCTLFFLIGPRLGHSGFDDKVFSSVTFFCSLPSSLSTN